MEPSKETAQERVERINREARRERKPDDPMQTSRPGYARPLAMLAGAVLVIAVVVLGVMWASNTRYDGAQRTPVAQGR